MNRFAWLPDFESLLRAAGIAAHAVPEPAPARRLAIAAGDWGAAAAVAVEHGCRWAGMWADAEAQHMRLHCVLEYAGDHRGRAAHFPARQDRDGLRLHGDLRSGKRLTTSFHGSA